MSLKQRGFSQGIFQQSSSKKEELGRLRVEDEKMYRYARAGATALGAGVFTVGEAIAAAHQNEAILAAEAIGTKTLTVTVTAGTAIDENELQGGEFLINDATGEGHTYVIESNTAITTATTEVNLTLKRGLKVALDTTSEFTLIRNPMWGAIVSTTLTLPLIGVTPIAVTADYYFWAQRVGNCSVLNDSTTMVTGQNIEQGAGTSGGMTLATATDTVPHLGRCIYAPAAGEYANIWLSME